MQIVPAIIPTSIEHLSDTLGELRLGREVQVDIVDGVFVPATSWPYTESHASCMALWEVSRHYDVELDLMIDRPEQSISEWAASGAKRVVLHLESTDVVGRCIQKLTERSLAVGLALLNDTPLSALKPYAHLIDFIQLMGIARIGVQGEPFDERVVERIAEARLLYPHLPVQVDGSVNRDTLPKMRDAGATRFVVGSALLGAEDPHLAYEELRALLTNHT